MGYYLLIFDPETAPTHEKEFIEWWKKKSEWEGSHDYNDFNVASDRLRGWTKEFIKDYPPMNGDSVPANDDAYFDNPNVTDYSFDPDFVYFCCAWSVAEEAAQTAIKLAETHGLGIYDLSGSESIIFPEGKTTGRKSTWWKFGN